MKTSLIFLCKYILPHTCVRLILLKKITCGISSHSGVAAAAVGGVSLLPGCQTAVFGIGETDSHNTPPPPQKTPQNLNFATFFRRRRRNREMQSRTPPPSHPTAANVKSPVGRSKWNGEQDSGNHFSARRRRNGAAVGGKRGTRQPTERAKNQAARRNPGAPPPTGKGGATTFHGNDGCGYPGNLFAARRRRNGAAVGGRQSISCCILSADMI